MAPEMIVFFVLALVAVVAALGMLLSNNAIYAALYLILNFASVAVFFLTLGGEFIAVTQVAVYAGAIMVLFLFVIMLLGAEKLGQSETQAWQRPVAIVLAVILAVETAYVLFAQRGELAAVEQIPSGFGSPLAIGQVLFQQYLLPFEVTSILLLAAIIGSVAIAKKKLW